MGAIDSEAAALTAMTRPPVAGGARAGRSQRASYQITRSVCDCTQPGAVSSGRHNGQAVVQMYSLSGPIV